MAAPAQHGPCVGSYSAASVDDETPGAEHHPVAARETPVQIGGPSLRRFVRPRRIVHHDDVGERPFHPPARAMGGPYVTGDRPVYVDDRPVRKVPDGAD